MTPYLYHDPRDALHTHDDDGLGAVFGGVPRPVADGVLGLNAEQEAGREAVDVHHAGGPATGVRGRRRIKGIVLRFRKVTGNDFDFVILFFIPHFLQFYYFLDLLCLPVRTFACLRIS